MGFPLMILNDRNAGPYYTVMAYIFFRRSLWRRKWRQTHTVRGRKIVPGLWVSATCRSWINSGGE